MKDWQKEKIRKTVEKFGKEETKQIIKTVERKIQELPKENREWTQKEFDEAIAEVNKYGSD